MRDEADAGDIRVGRYVGRVAEAFRTPRLLAELEDIERLVHDPHSIPIRLSRHRSVRVKVGSDAGTVELVLKAFGRQGLLKDGIDRWRGSKARRTWAAAAYLHTRDIGTPTPVGFLERWQGVRLMESYFLSVFQPGVVSFRDELIRLFRQEPDCGRFMALTQCVADAIRAMHAAGFLHNDLGNQNILLRRRDAGWEDVQFVDLNRGRSLGRLTLRERARDISRLYLPSDFLRVFKEMYFAPARPPSGFQTWERRFRRAYAAHCASRRFRHPLRTIRALRGLSQGVAEYPAEKDMWVWDERSAQAVNVLQRKDRRGLHRPGDALFTAAAAAAGAWRVGREYRALMHECFRSRVAMQGRVGVAVSAEPATIEREIGLLAQLGAVPVPTLVRFYHHKGKASWEDAARGAQRLRAHGHPVAVALVQDRQAALEPERWAAFVEEILARVAPFVEQVEVGHAVNRVKWGIWTRAEYRRMLAATAAVAARRPDVLFMGPAVIDFEYAALMGALRDLPPGLRFGALSHHLYVDRRGAPENRQGGFSALEKFALARAVARSTQGCGDRLIVSEVNWPLKGTGVYSPVGAPYESPGPRFNDPSVSEDDYADYMIRYLLLAFCSGMVERVYWWRLVARGFGLVDDTEPARWRERPAFVMLRQFAAVLGQSQFTRFLPGYPGGEFQAAKRKRGGAGRWFGFERQDGEKVWLAYTLEGRAEVVLPFECARAEDAEGGAVAEKPRKVVLSGRPLYLRGCGEWDA